MHVLPHESYFHGRGSKDLMCTFGKFGILDCTSVDVGYKCEKIPFQIWGFFLFVGWLKNVYSEGGGGGGDNKAW